jgi:hypothetical protein
LLLSSTSGYGTTAFATLPQSVHKLNYGVTRR